MKAWFEEHFQEDYLKVYDHRDEAKAAGELQSLMSYMPMRKGMKAVDLCCGNGRHARWLGRKGIDVTGIDLSPALLKKAIDLTNDLPVQYRRADIRTVELKQEFEAAFNVFTSFGYFLEDEENELVFQKAADALIPGGWFLFDYLNPAYVRKNLVPFDESERDGMTVLQERRAGQDYVEKKITIKENGTERRYVERVKLYEQHQLRQMLQRYDLEPVYFFGDYSAAEYDNSRSPRQIFICRKKGEESSQ
ncbi:bifunctional 2-polyprenyl-6-hydroxyphenol methylase/3-demethylubiquinol 3-O-methyltransferase UbiG [Sinobaca sp. H24]|uniref:class I SAM-dependent methyltransferase n=1 Tax=Sinobaca sp. H24 TaxID=2923376 RepID=UPI0020799CAD|nr:class I SAM-dependent methyltransferase [Sinobaca sp. H24]